MNGELKTQLLGRLAEAAVPDTLDLWPEIRARVAAPQSSPGLTAASRRDVPASGRRLKIALATVALFALIIGATLPLWNGAQPVNAQEILDRAQAAAMSPTGVTTYHLRMIQQVAREGNPRLTAEVWFGGGDRQRTRQERRDASGATVETLELVFNGGHAWLTSTRNGATRVVHTVGTAWDKPADDPTRETSLTDVLAKYGAAKSCTGAQLQGEATVANRPTYVIAVSPRPGGCAAKAGAATVPKDREAMSGAPATRADGPWRMLVWVDRQIFLPLKTEVRDPAGALVDRSEVTSVEYDIAIPDSIFTYTPPPGATVSEFSGGTGADVKRVVLGDPARNPPEPTSSPR